METEIKTSLLTGKNVCVTFILWSLIGCGIGLLVGVVGIAFHMALEHAEAFRGAQPWILWLLPFGGLAIVFFYRFEKVINDRGTNFILVAVRANEGVSLRMAPLIFFGTVVTHLFGGSAGREGAALQLGGSIASHIGAKLRLNEKDMRIITMTGMAAGFSALFGTPIAAVIFSMEVITVGVMHYSAMVPCMIGAMVATQLSRMFGIVPTAFQIIGVPTQFSLLTGAGVAGLALLCALVSISFCVILNIVSHGYGKFFKNSYMRVFVGGCIVILLTYIVGCRDYNGAGMNIIKNAVQGEVKIEAFFLKMVFTAVTLGAGYKGGEIVPSLFVGATFGCLVGPLLGLSPSFASGLGMVAVFCGVTNCPLTSIFLSIELFGVAGLGYYALCAAVSYMLSGYYGLYSEQKIMYSKTQPEFIDRNIHH